MLLRRRVKWAQEGFLELDNAETFDDVDKSNLFSVVEQKLDQSRLEIESEMRKCRQ